MTAKEKAFHLVDTMARIDGYNDSIDLSTCHDEIEYSLIAVNLLLDELIIYGYKDRYDYYLDVKSELELLKVNN